MASSPATVQDLIARSLRPLTDLELAWVGTRLDDAYTQIVALRPAVDARLTAAGGSDPFPRLVVQVQCAMVLRVLNNPDGVLEETSDDYTRRLDAAVSSGELKPTDAELTLLSAFDGAGDEAFSIRAIPGPQTGPDPWLLLGTTAL